MSRCEHCPAGWEDRSYEGECNDFGCRILGHEIVRDNCNLSNETIEKRLQELDDYHAGKIKRPQWVVNKFMRELDSTCCFNGEPHHVSYPPVWMRKGVYYPLYGSVDMHYQTLHDHRDGFKAGKTAVLQILNEELEKIKDREKDLVPDPMMCAAVGSQKAVVMRLIEAVEAIKEVEE